MKLAFCLPLEKTPKRDEAKEKDDKSFLLQNCEPDPSVAVGAGIAGAKPKKAKNSEPKSNLDVLKKIEELEKKDDEEEKSDDEKERTKDKEGEDDEEAEEPEEYDEEEQEEENDYISSYFEDGDDFGAGSDDNMDEATY
ncbi:hypothetical protein ASZ78_001979 [Callipepla squamata]|uniref:DNA-directed RNA polymerase III subunit n=1 Tax=Callipepla squamata TaxID=9009 RepID=A0A226MXZ5_CALSU|nr:hypothetical protein ASZ78_001979 [Callipepla squamata]